MAKRIADPYDAVRKLERNRLLVEYHETHPKTSYRKLGEMFNISGARAHEIIKKAQI